MNEKREFPRRDRNREPEKGEIFIRWKVVHRVLQSEIATHLGDSEGEIFLALAAALKKLGNDAEIDDEKLGAWFVAYLRNDTAALKMLLEPVEGAKA